MAKYATIHIAYEFPTIHIAYCGTLPIVYSIYRTEGRILGLREGREGL